MTERQLHLFRGKRQRGTKAPPPLEFEIHCMVADALQRWSTPGWFFAHYPGGEKRHPATAAKLKRMGVFAGVPDFIFWPPAGTKDMRCRFLELKREGADLSMPQFAFRHWAREHGYPHEVAHSYREAIEILQRWGALRSEVHVQ